MSKILLIYTGGTIGMMEDPSTGSLIPLNFQELRNYIPELRRFTSTIEVIAFDHPIDSSDISIKSWESMAKIIEEHYNDYDGFVILHGTDTMAYTASALSFMLHGLKKPVILTGSQLPMGRLRTDGKENMITAIEIANARRNGEPVIQEVAVLFDSKLFRGNRTHKYSTENFDAFKSPNYEVLANIGIHILYNNQRLLRHEENRMNVRYEFNRNVSILKIFPGMTPEYVNAVLNIEGIQGILLETYGSGNAPKEQWFIDALYKAIERNIIILNITQCSKGFVEQGLYQTSAALQHIGVIGGADLTTEAALTKMMFILGQYENVTPENREEIQRALITPIAGELTTFSKLSE